MRIEDYAADFREEPGYLDFAAVGPIGRAVAEEQAALAHVLEHARWGSMSVFDEQHERMRRAVAELIGFPADEIEFQPSTGQGLMHALFGIAGPVLVSSRDFPSARYAAQRAWQSGHAAAPRWFEPERGLVTPGTVRAALDGSIDAVLVSLVDFRTGQLIDLDGIRQVIGDRLLVVDATQGLGVVDVPWEVVDVIAAGGQKWPRAGWGTGILAVADRAVDRVTARWSRPLGPDSEAEDLAPAGSGASAFRFARADPVALARLATAVERMVAVGVGPIASEIRARGGRLIELADRHAIGVASPRSESDRAGIVVLDPGEGRVTALAAALRNHGISFTTRSGTVRLSAHVSTSEDSFTLLGDAFTSFGSTAGV